MAAVHAPDIGAWQRISGHHFVPLRCTTPNPTFTATICPVAFAPDVSVYRISSGPVRVERTDRLVHHFNGDDLLLTLQLKSTSTVYQYNRVARLSPGAAALYETNRPYVLDHPHPQQDLLVLLVLRIGRGRLGVGNRVISEVCSMTLDHYVPGMREFNGYLNGLVSEESGLVSGTRLELAAAAAELLAMVLRSAAGLGRVGWDNDDILLTSVKEYIRKQLRRPGLSVGELAQAHHVSVRKIHALFSSIGQTPATYVRTQRLERAVSQLLLRASTGQTIAVISESCGFTDPATFNRAFRRAYGCSPSLWKPPNTPA